MQKVVVASGYFDPLTVGHVEYLEKAKALGDKLVVIVNSDHQAKLKKDFAFIDQEERITIVKALRCVDEVFLSIDQDKTVCKSIEAIKPDIFAKGGDQNVNTIPEKVICDKLGVQIIDGLGDKIQSSRWLLKRVKDKLSDEYLNGQ